MTKMVAIKDLFTKEDACRIIDMWGDGELDNKFVDRVSKEIIEPRLADIEKKFGQKMDARYLAYCIMFAILRQEIHVLDIPTPNKNHH